MPDPADSFQRLDLYKRLASLPTPQLDQVVYGLKPPKGNLPPATAAPGDRVNALLTWAESRIGCGLEQVEQVLERVIAQAETNPERPWSVGEQIASADAGAHQDIQVGRSADHANLVSGNHNRLEVNHYYGLPEAKPEPVRPDPNEKTLIQAVWTEVEDRLRQSLHNAILIRLDMAEQRSQVSRPWDSQLRTADKTTKPLAPGTHIAEVFDRRDVGGKLLILGHPGSGKTTTMLDLAAVLIQQANTQPDYPIPVMFNLSSWQNAKQSLTDWLLSELKLKYGVARPGWTRKPCCPC
ncbi:MAG: hypothetical protein F6K42_21625 [Leptolyngbya sp. SIO1D8]|nr:hypothetical protein [Leptolyngbya sp. SIO1D8]